MSSKRFDPDFEPKEGETPYDYEELQEAAKTGFVSLQKLVRQAMGPRHAVLDEDGNPVVIEVYDQDNNLIEAKLMEWAIFFEKGKQRFTQRDYIEEHMISTIFLGLNHNYVPHGRPLWFETMAFGPPKETDFFGRKRMIRPDLGFTKRTETKLEAVAAHAEGVAWLKDYLAKEKLKCP